MVDDLIHSVSYIKNGCKVYKERFIFDNNSVNRNCSQLCLVFVNDKKVQFHVRADVFQGVPNLLLTRVLLTFLEIDLSLVLSGNHFLMAHKIPGIEISPLNHLGSYIRPPRLEITVVIKFWQPNLGGTWRAVGSGQFAGAAHEKIQVHRELEAGEEDGEEP